MSTTTKAFTHTSGPWHVTEIGTIEDDSHNPVRIASLNNVTSSTPRSANARLIAAAPELAAELLKKHAYLCGNPAGCSTCQVLQKAGVL